MRYNRSMVHTSHSRLRGLVESGDQWFLLQSWIVTIALIGGIVLVIGIVAVAIYSAA